MRSVRLDFSGTEIRIILSFKGFGIRNIDGCAIGKFLLGILHGKTSEAHSYIGIGCLSVGFRKIVTIYDSNKRSVLSERL